MVDDINNVNSTQDESPADQEQGWPNRRHLLLAAAQNRPDLVELIVNAGVDPNQADEVGETVLHDAVRLGRVARRAVATILPFVTQRAIRNQDGKTAAEIAADEEQHEIAQFILSQSRADSWWLDQPRVSDEARHLHFEELDASRAAWVLEQLPKHADWCKVPLDRVGLRHANLPFYDEGSLLAVEDTGRQGPREQFALVRFGQDFKPMDWKNAAILKANSEWAPRLNEETLPIYIHTFFHFVRGELGSFQVIEDTALVPWLPEVTSEWNDIVSMHMEPLRCLEIDAEKAIYRGIVLFKNALFASKIFVALKEKVFAHSDGEEGLMAMGGIKLYDELLLREDLPIRIAPPVTTWG